MIVSVFNISSSEVTFLNSSNYTLNKCTDEKPTSPFSLSYTPHGPIDITSDADFYSHGFSGLGSEEYPFVIEGFSFSTLTSDPRGYAISISDTTKHFVIRNCYIDQNEGSRTGSGIRIDNAVEGTALILNNTIINTRNGIYGWASPNITISNNFCDDNNNGILLSYCSKSLVVNNTCINNYCGIKLSSSSETLVTNNTYSFNADNGIETSYYSVSCIFTDNVLQENGQYGLSLHYESSKNEIYGNYFIDNNFVGDSQARDEGRRNKWYNSETNEGNFWSDLGDNCKYKIDGKASSKDLYPLNRNQSCPNPRTVSTLVIILPIVTGVAILAYTAPKYIIPYNREKNITKNIRSFLNRNRRIIFIISVIFFVGGIITMLMGLYLRAWSGDLEPAIIVGAVIALLALAIIIPIVIKKLMNRRNKKRNPDSN